MFLHHFLHNAAFEPSLFLVCSNMYFFLLISIKQQHLLRCPAAATLLGFILFWTNTLTLTGNVWMYSECSLVLACKWVRMSCSSLIHVSRLHENAPVICCFHIVLLLLVIVYLLDFSEHFHPDLCWICVCAFRLKAGGCRGVDVPPGPAGSVPEDAGHRPRVRSGQEGGAGPVSAPPFLHALSLCIITCHLAPCPLYPLVCAAGTMPLRTRSPHCRARPRTGPTPIAAKSRPTCPCFWKQRVASTLRYPPPFLPPVQLLSVSDHDALLPAAAGALHSLQCGPALPRSLLPARHHQQQAERRRRHRHPPAQLLLLHLPALPRAPWRHR